MTSNEYKVTLWNEFLETDTVLSEQEKEILREIVGCYIEDMKFLSNIYEAFIEGDRFLSDEENQVKYERDRDSYIFSFGDREVCLEKEHFRKILICMLDLLEDTLPLGTVVDLKKEVYQAAPSVQKGVENVRMVITYRYLGNQEDKFFYPYGGVVYPTGMLGEKKILYFTRPLIDTIVQRGFSNEQEDIFVYLMKKDLIIDGGLNSFGYAPKEEIELFNSKVKGVRNE